LSGGFQEDWDVGLYRNARFVIASIAAFLYESAFNSANFLTAVMRQQVFPCTPFHTGTILAPGAMAMGLAGVGAGRLADIIDPRGPIFPGLLLQAAAMYYFALTSLEVSTLWFTFLVVLHHMSFGCVYTPLTSIVLKTLPHDRLSIVSGLDGIRCGLAGAFGIALGSTTPEYRTMVHVIGLGEAHEVWTPSVPETAAIVSQLLPPRLSATTGSDGRLSGYLLAPLCGDVIGIAPRFPIAGVAEKFYNADQIDERSN
jgi:MFS family permease